MNTGETLTRRLVALETKVGIASETVYLFQRPGEEVETAIERSFGVAGVPAGAKLIIFTWLPQQDEPGPESGF